MSRDPVCGMDVQAENAVAKSDYQGETYYFCSVGCKRTFDGEPDKFAQANREQVEH